MPIPTPNQPNPVSIAPSLFAYEILTDLKDINAECGGLV